MSPETPYGEEWRAAAARPAAAPEPREAVLDRARVHIEKHRKADAELTLRDADGQPLAGVEVDVGQVRHAFAFGGALGDDIWREDTDERQNSAARFRQLFNTASCLCYWDEFWHHPIERFEGRRNVQPFLDAVTWTRGHGLEAKGHTLIFTAPKCYPDWLARYDEATRFRHLENHVRGMIAAADGRVTSWDLVNEMLWEPSFRHYPQREWPHVETTEELLTFIVPAVQWAREQDPDARYVLNEYGLEDTSLSVPGSVQRARFIALIKALRAEGAAPDALGSQSHTGGWHPIGHYHQVWDELAQAGLPLQVTEFWVREQEWPGRKDDSSAAAFADAQAAYAVDFYTAAFGHPAMEHLTYWGWKDFFQRHRDGERLRRTNAMFAALDELINRTWWTPRATLTTDAEGSVRFRGFRGDYTARFRDARGNHFGLRFAVDPVAGEPARHLWQSAARIERAADN